MAQFYIFLHAPASGEFPGSPTSINTKVYYMASGIDRRLDCDYIGISEQKSYGTYALYAITPPDEGYSACLDDYVTTYDGSYVSYGDSRISDSYTTWKSFRAMYNWETDSSLSRDISELSTYISGNYSDPSGVLTDSNVEPTSYAYSDILYDGVEVATYEVVFYHNDGTETKTTKSVLDGKTVECLTETECTRTGYNLLGWSDTKTGTVKYTPGQTTDAITGTTTYYAIWEAKEYTVTYDANGGNNTKPTEIVKYGQMGTYPTSTECTKDNYNLLGWSDSATDKTAKYTSLTTTNITGNVTYYAVWGIKTYTVTYDANGGTTSKTSDTVSAGGIELFPTSTECTRTGYNLLGWSDSATDTEAKYVEKTPEITKDVTYYAIWTKENVTTYYFNIRVKDKDSDETLPGATVILYTDEARTQSSGISGATDAGGEVTFTDTKKASRTLYAKVSLTGYDDNISETVTSTTSNGSDYTTIYITETEGGEDPSAKPEYYIKVKVVEKSTQDAIYPVSITVTSGSSTIETGTSTDGTWVSTSVDIVSGTYDVAVIDKSGVHKSNTVKVKSVSESSTEYTLIELEPVTPYYIKAIVLDDTTGSVISGATINVYDTSGSYVTNGTTNSSGKWQSSCMAYYSENYLICASATGYSESDKISTVTVTSDTDTWTEIRLVKSSGSSTATTTHYLNIKIVNTSGTGISGAYFTGYNTSGTEVFTGKTDANGKASYSGLTESATYYVTASASGYMASTSKTQISTTTSSTTYSKITLTSSSSGGSTGVNGKIKDEFNLLTGSSESSYNEAMTYYINRLPKTWSKIDTASVSLLNDSKIVLRAENITGGSVSSSYNNKIASRVANLTNANSSSYTVVPKIQAAYGFANLGNYVGSGISDSTFVTTHKIGYEDRDRYSTGSDTCNSYLFLSPVNHSEIQVEGDTIDSTKFVKSANSLRVPVIYQYRMTDYNNNIFGNSSYIETDAIVKSSKYANIIGVDIWTDRNAIKPRQYDIVIYSTYGSTVDTNTARTKTSTQTLVDASSKIAVNLDKLVNGSKSVE